MDDSAYRTIERALTTGQIGVPVAIRVVDGRVSDRALIESRLARMLDVALHWLGAEPSRLAAYGGREAGQITALVTVEDGWSILASAGIRGEGPGALEAVVFASHGILSWEPGYSARELGFADAPTKQLSPRAERLSAAIGRSLSQRRPVACSGEPVLESTTLEVADPYHRVPGDRVVSPPREPLAPPYGVLLVAGDHTHQPGYAEAFASDPRCRLIGLTDERGVPPRRKQLNERLARRLGIPLLPDLAQALARDDVQIVSICAEPYRRGKIIVQAAEAGKHLYLDKPLCATLQETNQVVAAVQRAGVAAQMFSQVHWEPTAQVRRLVETRALGDLLAIHCDLCFAKGPAGTADLSIPRREVPTPTRYEQIDSKRELTNIGVYGLAMVLTLTRQRVRRVFASTGNYFFAEHQRNDMEDFGQLLLETEGGITASISTGRTGWRSHPGGGLNRTYVVGTRRTAVVDAYRRHVEVWADVEPWSAPQRDPDDPMGMWAPLPDSPYRASPKQGWITPSAPSWTTDVQSFLECIERGLRCEVSVEIAASATQVLLAAYRSAADGCTVELRTM